MDAQTAHLLLAHMGVHIHFLISRWVEGHALVTEHKGQGLQIGVGVNLYQDDGTRTLRIGVVHDVDHRLLDRQSDALFRQLVEAHIMTDAAHEDTQGRHLLHVVEQRDTTVIQRIAHAALILDGEQRDIVALRDEVHKHTLSPTDLLDEGTRVEVLGRQAQGLVAHALLTKLLPFHGLCLRIAIGIEEERRVPVNDRALLGIFPVRAQTQGDVVVGVEETRVRTTHQHRGLVTCIRIEQTAIRQVEHTHEERHEHERVVALTHRAVDRLHDQLRRDIGHRRTAEHRARHRHHQRSRHTLACHVADTEIEFIVADEEVEEVAAHLLRRHHLTEDVDIGTLRERRIHLRQHALLDVAGNPEFLLHRHVRGGRLLQLFHIVHQ